MLFRVSAKGLQPEAYDAPLLLQLVKHLYLHLHDLNEDFVVAVLAVEKLRVDLDDAR